MKGEFDIVIMSASRLVQWHRHRRWQRPLGTLFQVLFLLIAVMLGVTTQASTVNDCHSVRYAYLAKGLDLKDVPRQPRQGKPASLGLIQQKSSYATNVLI